MEIKTKYNLYDEVYIIKENKIVKRTISGVNVFAGVNSIRVSYDLKKDTTDYTNMTSEEDVFPSKEALLEYLQSE